MTFLVGVLLTPVAQGALTLGHATPGNVFFNTETVRVPVTCTGDRIEWTVTDFFGIVQRQGSVTPVGGAAVILPPAGRLGYFDLRVVEKQGGAVSDEKRTRFAVLRPIDVATMGGSPFGAQTHGAQGGSLAVYGLLARAGIAHFRDEHYWSATETAPSTYQYPARFTEFMAAAAAVKMRPLLTLNWAHPDYDYEAGMFTAPHSDAGRTGYANYGAEVVRNYPEVAAVEVWNEYNADTFITGPATLARPAYYKSMLERTFGRVKAVRPDVKVVAGGTVPIAHGFLRDLFEQGAMPFLDVVSVHPYRTVPDAVDVEIAELRALIKRHNGGVEKPIWASEFSREVNSEAEQGEAATYLAQIVPLMLSQRVERMYFYVGSDDYAFPYRGLIASENDPAGAFTPHPVYVAYANVIRQLYGCTFQSRFPGTASSTYALRFDRGSTRINVMWAATPVSVTIRTSSSLLVTDMMGQSRKVWPVNGVVTLTLTRNPQYVQGAVTSVADSANRLLADSVSGYGAAQGGYGWSYGSAWIDAGGVYDPTRFTPMRWDYSDGNAVCWLLGQWHFISVEQMHPSSSWAVRRWTSPVAATVTLSGRVARGSHGDGVNVAIQVDGRVVYSRYLAPDQAEDYEVKNVVIAAGSRVDFTVNEAGESSYDSTHFTARVTRQ